IPHLHINVIMIFTARASHVPVQARLEPPGSAERPHTRREPVLTQRYPGPRTRPHPRESTGPMGISCAQSSSPTAQSQCR
ncbi:hypothetical protein BC826DRAFT_1053823, partial [Russula brevipes]